ncbi:hypothetical protein [Pseudoalteromonas nigrifaciens]|uniref:hypothetical protein n=1 Tax=Pseudoalteromonas nigrifaciens TaxID=28109 RepID=UPI001865C710|nr:hypothetical protein [Pseudoalteromonas nigrifaciens]
MRVTVSALLSANKSFLIMALSSLLYFAATFLAKKTMTEDDFYYWNVLLTVSAISYSFCFFGSEQLFLRCGQLRSGQYYVPANIIKIMIVSFSVYLVLFSLLTNMVLFRVNDFRLTILVGLLSASCVFVYNLLRITKLFTASQLINNFWKAALFLAVLIANGSNVREILYATLLLCLLVAVIVLIKTLPKINFTEDSTDNLMPLFIGFALSLFVLVLMNNFDRFFIETYFTKEEFSNYVYLLSLLIMPFSIVSSYIGFKEVAMLKTCYIKSEFHKKVILIGGGLAFIFTLWFAAVSILSGYLELDIQMSYFFPCIAIVVIKSIYSLYSAIFGLKATAQQIQVSNIISVVVVLLGASCSYLLIKEPFLILYVVAAVWLIRVLLFGFLIRHLADYQTN